MVYLKREILVIRVLNNQLKQVRKMKKYLSLLVVTIMAFIAIISCDATDWAPIKTVNPSDAEAGTVGSRVVVGDWYIVSNIISTRSGENADGKQKTNPLEKPVTPGDASAGGAETRSISNPVVLFNYLMATDTPSNYIDYLFPLPALYSSYQIYINNKEVPYDYIAVVDEYLSFGVLLEELSLTASVTIIGY